MTDKTLAERLREEPQLMEVVLPKWRKERAEAAEALDAKDAEIERLREALRWYEALARDCRKVTEEGERARHTLEKDQGSTARAALRK